jgi:hypothetical protein
MTRLARVFLGRSAGVAMLRISPLNRPVPGALAALAFVLAMPAPLAAQQGDTTTARGAQIISPEAGRRRAEAAGTVIPGEHPAGPLSFAPDSVPELSDLLTAREIERMGLGKLTETEQQELAALLVRWRRMGRFGMGAPGRMLAVPLARRFPATTRVEVVGQGDPRSATAIADVAAGGTLIVLGDGTIWEVYLPDRVKTASWSAGEAVRVRAAAVEIGSFDYELLNGGEANRALVRFRGRSDAR